VRERLAAARPVDPAAVLQLVASYARLGALLDGEEARKVLDRMKSALDGIPPARSNDAPVLGAWIYYYDLAAGIASETKDVQALRENRGRQVEVAERLAAMEPTNPARQRNLALADRYYGGVLHTMGEHKLARERYDRAVELDLAGVAAEPSAPQRKIDLSFSHASVGSLLRDEGHLDAALLEYRKALQLRRDVYAADPDNEQAFRVLVRAHQSLASVFVRKPDLAATASHLREVLALQQAWEKKHSSAPGQAGWQAAFHESLGDHVAFVAALPALPPGQRREHWLRARDEYTRARALWLELAGKQPLEAEHAANPQKLEQAIAKCDAALAGLERGR
jgi:tetratricopeptide (TPR) repeat protein